MSNRRNRHTESDADSDFQRAAKRLERAVQELITAARDQFSDSAAAFVEETTERLRERAGRAERGARRSRRNRWHGEGAAYAGSGDRLFRSRRDAWIGGVCGGLAEYFEMESWVVRLIAVSLLLFSPLTGIVALAYCAAWCILPRRPRPEALGDDPLAQETAGKGRQRTTERPLDHRPSLAPELGPRFSPRRSLREIRARFDAIELKLRRIESFVTSPRFELERELARMDGSSH